MAEGTSDLRAKFEAKAAAPSSESPARGSGAGASPAANRGSAAGLGDLRAKFEGGRSSGAGGAANRGSASGLKEKFEDEIKKATPNDPKPKKHWEVNAQGKTDPHAGAHLHYKSKTVFDQPPPEKKTLTDLP